MMVIESFPSSYILNYLGYSPLYLTLSVCDVRMRSKQVQRIFYDHFAKNDKILILLRPLLRPKTTNNTVF